MHVSEFKLGIPYFSTLKARDKIYKIFLCKINYKYSALNIFYINSVALNINI
jgi:hypothetical protein